MISEKRGARFFATVVQACTPKVSVRHTKKICIPEFPVLSARKRPLCGLVTFIGMEHVYTYRRQEFQNILERKLSSCFGQLLLIY